MHVVLFDIDGTLIRSGGAGARATQKVMRDEFGIEQPQSVPLHGCTDRGIARDLFALHGLANSAENWNRFIATYLKLLDEELANSPGEVLPGVELVLDSLARRSDVYLGLLTGNVRLGAQAKLRRYGLAHHFRGGGFGDLHPDRDDVARAARQHVEQELGHPAKATSWWVIGDTPADVRCARAINAKVVAVATGGSDPHALRQSAPDLFLDDLTAASIWLAELPPL